jgi:DNA-binding GntR family transcriptional regulator
VQEALVQPEHDGILETRYHRGAFVQRFDEASLREHHEVHGLLTGAVSARAAAEPRTEVLDELDGAMTIMRNADGPEPSWKARRDSAMSSSRPTPARG